MPRQPSEFEAVHKAADYYEPLLRARFVRAMKALRATITVEDIARAIQLRQTTVVPRSTIEKVLAKCANVVRDAVMQGGKLGADRVRKL